MATEGPYSKASRTMLDSLVDCMNCLVSRSVVSLEIELASPDLQVVRIHGITHAVQSRSPYKHVAAGWTLCHKEFRHFDFGAVECDGEGWAIPVDQAPGARGPRGSSDP